MLARFSQGPHLLTLPPLDQLGVEARAVRFFRLNAAPLGPQPSPSGLRLALDRALEQARNLPLARGAFVTLSVRCSAQEEWLQPQALQPWLLPGARQRLAQARRLSAYLVTLGEDWDKYIEQLLSQDQSPQAYFLHHLAGLYIDASARALEAQLGASFRAQGLVACPRIRPGYRNQLPLAAQATLCALVQAERLHVRLTEEYFLIPTQSVTGVIGWKMAES